MNAEVQVRAQSEQESQTIRDRFLEIDYQVSGHLLQNYSNMRLVALGGLLTIVGLLISAADVTSPRLALLIWLVLQFSVVCGIRVIGSLNANVYVRCLHLEWLEEKFHEMGYFTYWNHYVTKHGGNAASNAFVVSCIGFNIVAGIFTLYVSVVIFLAEGTSLLAVWPTVDIDSAKGAAIVLLCIVSLTTYRINSIYIEKNMYSARLIPRLREEVTKARRAHSEKMGLI